jgi:hypothetical protein
VQSSADTSAEVEYAQETSSVIISSEKLEEAIASDASSSNVMTSTNLQYFGKNILLLKMRWSLK